MLPLSTAYSVGELFGREAAVDDPFREAPLFYGTFGLVVAVAAGFVLIPGMPLVPVLFLSQALNAILLIPLLWAVYGAARDPETMGAHVLGRRGAIATLATIWLVTASVVALGVLALA